MFQIFRDQMGRMVWCGAIQNTHTLEWENIMYCNGCNDWKPGILQRNFIAFFPVFMMCPICGYRVIYHSETFAFRVL